MRALRSLAIVGALATVITAGGAATAAARAGGAGSYVLTATNTGSTYAPTFTGNGMLGVRVPPAGQGYAPGTVPAQSELAGLYAQPPGGVQQRANIPTWSTLTFADGGQPFSLSSGTTSNWRQSLDLRTGVITTTADWTAPDGHLTHIEYQVLTDRSRQYVGLVRLELTPSWSGTATVTDEIDGSPATLTTQVSKGWVPAAHRDWVIVQTQGTGIDAALASQLRASGNVQASYTEVDQSTDQSVGQQLSFPVTSGHTYTFTKYVGVESSQDASDPGSAAQAQASSAAAAGWDALLAGNTAAWSALWRGRIDVLGDPTLATDVNASEFYLWSSTRPGVDWSISPAGLSSNGYNGHIFWDAETWMFPALLAQHPDLAAGINAYRYQRLAAAEQHAAETGYKGARYPWESALDGTEQIPPPVSVNSEGLYEQHITADIALAQWQYYLATGDKAWLAQQGWPVISQAAMFWASRATLGSDGLYHINGVTGPDEENPDVNDEVYTNVAAKTTLQDATLAAQALGLTAPSSWSQIASKIVVLYDPTLKIHPEFSGYAGQLVKQADVTLLQYPWQYPMPATVAQNDLNYYVPRTDPTGPSMSDSVNSIDTSALGSPGCASYVYTERSYQPFIRDVFDQFSETKSGGAFTFMTGIGGFLQEFLYGYSGLRWNPANISLAPVLTSQLGGIVLHNLAWRGRRFEISIGASTTTLRLIEGAPLAVRTPSGIRTVSTGAPLRINTRRPDLKPTADLVRCANASASSSQIGAPPLAAVDGSPATDWQPVALPATLTAPIAGGSSATVSSATLRWGQQWPPSPAPNVPPPPGPVTTLRASDYTLQASLDGQTWQTLATVSGRTTGTLDVLRFAPTRARFVRVVITAGTGTQPPMLEELTVTG
ncbi:MAG: discoidin domain-containing protein [Solirubrobacterales bacterium]|nr:discoidin domain-containing protein [Solirubrobacterales bacterium]